ncbi:MAG: hypothetical protein WD770_07140 [Actinomycetota bacterium]
MTLRRLVLACLATSLIVAGCGDGGGDGGDGGGGAATTPGVGECPDATDLRGDTGDADPFTLNVVSSFAERTEDDTLYGDYYRVVFADFQLEPGETINTESGERAIEIEVYGRDQTLPPPGTYDFEGQQNTFFQPTFYEGGTAQPLTTLGPGGTLTLAVANDQEVCGGIDVSDGSVTIQGAFRASLVTE